MEIVGLGRQISGITDKVGLERQASRVTDTVQWGLGERPQRSQNQWYLRDRAGRRGSKIQQETWKTGLRCYRYSETSEKGYEVRTTIQVSEVTDTVGPGSKASGLTGTY